MESQRVTSDDITTPRLAPDSTADARWTESDPEERKLSCDTLNDRTLSADRLQRETTVRKSII